MRSSTRLTTGDSARSKNIPLLVRILLT